MSSALANVHHHRSLIVGVGVWICRPEDSRLVHWPGVVMLVAERVHALLALVPDVKAR